MLTIKGMTLRSVASQYHPNKAVRIHDNGKKIFMGSVGAINKTIKKATLDRNCEVYESCEFVCGVQIEDGIYNIYLERKV